MVRYVIAYDIASPRRLRRVARVLERHAIRTQKSVFLYVGNDASLKILLDELGALINIREDTIQAWRLGAEQLAASAARGNATVTTPAAAVLHSSRPLFVQGRQT